MCEAALIDDGPGIFGCTDLAWLHDSGVAFLARGRGCCARTQRNRYEPSIGAAARVPATGRSEPYLDMESARSRGQRERSPARQQVAPPTLQFRAAPRPEPLVRRQSREEQ